MDAVSVFHLAEGDAARARKPAVTREEASAESPPEEAPARFVAQPTSRKSPARLPASLDDEWEEF